MSDDQKTAFERTYYRSAIKHDWALAIFTFGWVYWLCELRIVRKTIGGRWYKIGGNFWSQREFGWTCGPLATESWAESPLKEANKDTLAILARCFLVLWLGVFASSMVHGPDIIPIVAPIIGIAGLAVWLGVFFWAVVRR